MTYTQQIEMAQLYSWLETVSTKATSTDHLQTAETEAFTVPGAMNYEVQVLTAKRSKPRKQSKHSPEPNPFLPYDPAMYVTHLSAGHIILLNKFNIVPNHYLIVTPEFEEQKTELQLKEFKAVAEVLPAFNQLIFYNSGREAGASQPHRHLQALPANQLPIDSALSDLPVKPGQIKTLPFRHLVCRLKNTTPETLHELYQQMIESLALRTEEAELLPYNLLITKEWMMVIPRTHGRFETISINSLGFAGLLLVKNREMLSQLIAAEPDNVLKAVTSY